MFHLRDNRHTRQQLIPALDYTHMLMVMVCAAEVFVGSSIMIPTSNGDLFRWYIENGLRLNQQLTLMSTNPTGLAEALTARIYYAKGQSYF